VTDLDLGTGFVLKVDAETVEVLAFLWLVFDVAFVKGILFEVETVLAAVTGFFVAFDSILTVLVVSSVFTVAFEVHILTVVLVLVVGADQVDAVNANTNLHYCCFGVSF